MRTTDASVAANALRQGQLVAIPTETVYGLAADVSNADAVRKIFAVKGRPTDHPLILHCADTEQLDRWARDIPASAWALASAFWPGPLTLLLWRSELVSDEVTGGRDTVGIRVPNHELTRFTLREFAGAVAAPSANRFGKVSPTSAEHVEADLGNDVDVILDGGSCQVGVESTIVDLTGEQPIVLRLGAVTIEQLTEVLGVEPEIANAQLKEKAKAPGMLASHYAPSAQVVLADEVEVSAVVRSIVAEKSVKRIAVLAPMHLSIAEQQDDIDIIELEPAGDAEHYAAVLYDRLRLVDRLGIDVVVCVPPEQSGIGRAVCDRLQRAATR